MASGCDRNPAAGDALLDLAQVPPTVAARIVLTLLPGTNMSTMSKTRDIPALIIWLILCFATAYVGAMATRDAPVFYAQLSLASWAPPASVFGPVWTVLYTMMAIAAWMVWQRRNAPGADVAIGVFVLQLVVNALWSWVFFAWHRGALAFVNIVVLWLLIVATILLFKRIRPSAALMLVPYLAWVSFATALAYSAWQRNPGLL